LDKLHTALPLYIYLSTLRTILYPSTSHPASQHCILSSFQFPYNIHIYSPRLTIIHQNTFNACLLAFHVTRTQSVKALGRLPIMVKILQAHCICPMHRAYLILVLDASSALLQHATQVRGLSTKSSLTAINTGTYIRQLHHKIP